MNTLINNNTTTCNNMTGTLTVKIVSADLKKDKDFILKQDPYCLIKFGNKSFKTKTHMFGGKHPSWTDVFTMKKTNEDMLQVSVFDKDLLSKDDFLGSGAVAINNLMQTGRYTTWINLNDVGKYTGKVLIETEFKPDVTIQTTQPQFTQQTHQQLTHHQTQPQYTQQTQPLINQQPVFNQIPQTQTQMHTLPLNDLTKNPNYGTQNVHTFCPTVDMATQKQMPIGYQGLQQQQQHGLYPGFHNTTQQGYPQQTTLNQGTNFGAPCPAFDTNQGYQGQQKVGFNGTNLPNAKPFPNQFSFN